MKRRILAIVAVVLIAVQIVLILLSWIVSSVFPAFPCKSVLSSEGIRWLFGSFTGNVSNWPLVWLLLCAIAYGAFVHSGLRDSIISLARRRRLAYRQRHALYTVALVLCAMLFAVSLLAFVPHALLLGVSGGLYPSAFSSAVVPMIAFAVVVVSLVYGTIGGVYTALSDAFRGMYAGIYAFAPFFPIYILAVELYFMIRFVFFE